MKLSIAMIVKNEEKNIERTLIPLKKLQDYIDSEIIIVDTGSTDKTVEIARKYTDKVYFHTWNNNFGAMRNISISYCTGDWILIVDADEVLYDIKKLADLIKGDEFNKYNGGFVDIINFNKDIETSINNGFIAPILRLFKNNNIKYEGIVHEQPNCNPPVAYSNIRFIHYGYNNNDYELMEYKFKRNLELLLKQLNDKSNSKSMQIYINFQISTSYAMHKEMTEALKYIRVAYDKAKNEISKYIYVINRYCHILYNLKEFRSLIDKAKEGVKYYSEFIDFYFYLGQAYYNLNEYDDAIDAYNKYLYFCEELKNNNIITSDTLTIITREHKDSVLCNLAVSYYKLNLYNKALETLFRIENKDLLTDKAHLIFRIIVEGKLWENISVLDSYIDKFNYEAILLYVHKEISQEDLKTIQNLKLPEAIEEVVSFVKYFRENNKLTEKQIDRILDIIKESKMPYAIYLYYVLKSDIRKIKDFISYGRDKIESILITLCCSYYEFNAALMEGLNEVKSDTLTNNIIRALILKALLLSGNLPEGKKKGLFLDYIAERYYLIINSYNKEIIKDNVWVLSSEERFIINLKNSLSYKYENTLKYIRDMKESLSLEKSYIGYINLLIEDDEELIVNKEIKAYIPELVKNINSLIKNGKYQEAYNTIEEGLALVKFDFDLMILKYNLLMKFTYEEEGRECLKNIILYGDNERVNNLINSL